MPPSPTSLALVALVVAVSPLAGQGRRYAVAGGEVAIFDLAGTVSVEAGSGSEVTVEVTPAGADAARLRVDQGDIAGRQTLRVIFPDDRIRYRRPGNWSRDSHSRTELRVRDDGTFDEGHLEHGRRDREGRRVVVSSDDGVDAHADLRVLVPEGRSVAVYLAVGRVTATNVDGRLRLDTSDADVEATGTRGSLIASLGSGDVKVTDHDGELTIDTGSGDVTVDRARGAKLGIDTGSGDVLATGVSAADLRVDTGSGNVRLTGGGAQHARLETGSGDVTVTLDQALREVSVETGSGDVTLRLPAGLGAEVDLETSSGDIETDFAVSVTRHADDHLTGRIGDGGGRITVETGSGGVRLLKS